MSRDAPGGHVTSRDIQQAFENKGGHVTGHVTSRDRLPFAPSPPKELSNPPSTPLPDDDARARAKLGQRLPDNWAPSDALCAFAEGLGFAGRSLDEAVAEFRDFWRGIPGQRGRKLDWDATFRNRLRETAARKKGPGNGKRSISDVAPSFIERVDQLFADVRSPDSGAPGGAAIRGLPSVRRQQP